jgi:catechol 2,3-dioxygenase-like lactoylglutathione lyase family enzyme
MPDLTVNDVRPFVPAEDFATSRAFYTALGWHTVWTDEVGLALVELGGHQLMLQNYYVREWAENSMLVVEVADAQAWYEHIAAAIGSGEFGGARVEPPARQDYGATVTFVWDPCGVLLHFTQWDG